MHLSGIGAVYGPQLPCCANAEAAAASSVTGGDGPACDPNCVAGNVTPTDPAVIARMQAAIDANTQALYSQQTPTTDWFPGVSNGAVILVGVGLGALVLFGRRR